MQAMDESALLRQYVDHHSDEAFAALVARHVNLVYSVALRQAGQPQNAEEITQAVFIILAKKAAGLRHERALSSWLFQATRLTAINFVRSEIRRQHREQEAHVQSVLNESGDPTVWRQIAPLLDAAVAALTEKDRRAIVLRFYEGRNLREVGAALGVNEEAAKKRVARGLEKLQRYFSRRGVDSTAAAIGETISANSVQAAPVALAKTITAATLAKGAAASTSTLTLVKGVLKIMAWTKAKTAIVAGAIVLFTAGTTTVVIEKVAHPGSLEQRLPDGSVLILGKVSFGDKHEFVHGGKKVDRSWPGHEELVAEFGVTGKNAASNPLVMPLFYRQFRCVIHGETGIDFVEEFFPPGFKKYPDGFYNYIETSIFPRDSKWLWFRVEKSETNNPYGPWQTVAEFKVPNPARPANYSWFAGPAPITNTVDGMDLVLGEVTVETRPFSPSDIWNHHVTFPTEVFDHGVLLTNWGAAYGQIEDASGNFDPGLQTHRSLDPRYVWKFDMDFEPVSDFPAEDLATVDLPRRGGHITTEVMNVPVTISWVNGTMIDASMPTNRPDLALVFVSAADEQGNVGSMPSGSWNKYSFWKGNFEVQKGGVWTMDFQPTKVTFAVVPNVHTTFYIQPRLVTETAK